MSLVKFIRESDWDCLCDGRYLLPEQIEMWSEISDVEQWSLGAGAWKISQTVSNIILQ